jgi:hypothetical protein
MPNYISQALIQVEQAWSKLISTGAPFLAQCHIPTQYMVKSPFKISLGKSESQCYTEESLKWWEFVLAVLVSQLCKNFLIKYL